MQKRKPKTNVSQRPINNHPTSKKRNNLPFYKKPWFAASAIILVFVMLLSMGANALWQNTLGQINFVKAEDKDKNLDLSNLTPEELESLKLETELEELVPITPYDKDITNILLLGIDSRDPNKVDERSDAMMVLTINKTQGKVKLTSLQRDMLVEMPGKDMMDKLNHANTYGGPTYVMKTVNNALRLDLDRYVVVNMRGMEKLIDLIDGIEINVEEHVIPFVNANINETNLVFYDTPDSPFLSSPGKQNLNGRQAVGYARNRSTGGGDYDRMGYQQEVLQGVFSKFLSVNATKKFELLKEGFGLVTTNLTTEEILGMAQSVLPALDNKVETLTIPIEGYHVHYSGAAWLNLCDFNGMIPLVQKFIYGKTFDFEPVAEIPGAPNSLRPIEAEVQIDQWVTPDETDPYGNLYVQEPDVDLIYPSQDYHEPVYTEPAEYSEQTSQVDPPITAPPTVPSESSQPTTQPTDPTTEPVQTDPPVVTDPPVITDPPDEGD